MCNHSDEPECSLYVQHDYFFLKMILNSLWRLYSNSNSICKRPSNGLDIQVLLNYERAQYEKVIVAENSVSVWDMAQQ